MTLNCRCVNSARIPRRSGTSERGGDSMTWTCNPASRASCTNALVRDSVTAAISTVWPIAEWPRASDRTTVSRPPESAGARTCRIASGRSATSGSGWTDCSTVQRFVAAHHRIETELLNHALARDPCIAPQLLGIAHSFGKRPCERLGVARRNEPMFQLVTQHRRVSSHVGDDRTQAGAHRFEKRYGGAFAVRRHAEQRERGRDSLDVAAPSEKVYGFGDPQCGRGLLEQLPLAAVTDENQNGFRQRGPVRAQPCECVDHHAIALDRLEPADASDHGDVRRDSDLGTKICIVVARNVALGIDAVRDDTDARGVRHERDEMLFEAIGYRNYCVDAARGAFVDHAMRPRVRIPASVVSVDLIRYAGHRGGEARLVQHTTVQMRNIRRDHLELAREPAGVQHRPAWHGVGDVKRRQAFEPFAEVTHVSQREHVQLEAGRIGALHHLGDEALHTAVVEIVDDVYDADLAFRHQRSCWNHWTDS